MRTKVFMVSLGCPKNRVDSERALWALRQAGAELTLDENEADILLANTCGFIEAAKEESIETILSLARVKEHRPSAKLAVMGCLSERYRADLAESIPEIDHIFGVADLQSVVNELAPNPVAVLPDPDAGQREITTAPHWSYLKIAEGCSNKCSFCVIPSIRGPYKSRGMDSLVQEARSLAERGVKELILVAQDTTLYAADLKVKNGLEKLLRRLEEVEGISWIRVLYMYPALVDDSLIDIITGSGKIVPYFDIPLQHISNRVLKYMGRPETGDSIRKLLDKIRGKSAEAAIRASFIVGFPGEDDGDFAELMRFVEGARLDHVGAFAYSPEEGTSAYKMSGAVDREVAEERRDILMSAQNEISAALLRGKIGSVMDVMVDGADPEEPLLTGRTKAQAPEIDGQVILDSVAAEPGEIIKVKITGAVEYDLIATVYDGAEKPLTV